jgi:hypothetical protein
VLFAEECEAALRAAGYRLVEHNDVTHAFISPDAGARLCLVFADRFELYDNSHERPLSLIARGGRVGELAAVIRQTTARRPLD